MEHDEVLHDIGKLRVPAEVFKKPEAFTDHERAVMRHTVRGWWVWPSVSYPCQRIDRLAPSYANTWFVHTIICRWNGIPRRSFARRVTLSLLSMQRP